MATTTQDSIPISGGVHGVPGDEVVAAKETVPAAAALIMESERRSTEDEEDYSSQSEDKAGLGNFWVYST